MPYDPLGIILEPIEWWVFWLVYALLDIIINLLFCYAFGKKQRVREFFKDPLSILWPFLVLGPIAGGYLSVNQTNNNIQINLNKLGLNYESYSIGFQNEQNIFWVTIVIALIIAISTRVRYEKFKPNIWFSKPKFFGRFRTILFDLPMAYMAIMTLIMLIDQWAVIYNFLSSTWLPGSPFHIDGLYGINWVYKRVMGQIIIALLISLGPLIMMTREGKQKYSWLYKILFIVGVIIIAIATFILANKLNEKINFIFLHFFSIYIDSTPIFPSPYQNQDIGYLLQQIILGAQIDRLLTLPKKLVIPPWIESLLGIRILVFFFLEIYGNLAKKYSWPQFPQMLAKVLNQIQ
jgi:hypothetical protein